MHLKKGTGSGRLKRFVHSFGTFGIQQALCCLFPAAIFLMLAGTKLWMPPYIHRYDLILAGCILVQYLMVRLRLESLDELKVICVFHIIGLCLELYKVHMGSWAYPEPAWSKVGGVPLYSGFMYASVASYICQAWKRFDLRFQRWPGNGITWPLAVIIYLNFFTHHYLPDFRWGIAVALVPIFWRSFARFQVLDRWYRMPMLLSFGLIGFFIWVAENISTFFGAWQYPEQHHGWQMVHMGKISSWFMLIIISVIIVANLKHIKYREGGKANPATASAE